MTYLSEVLADSPSALYLLDETSGTVAADSSGNGNDGEYTNTTLGVPGLVDDGGTAVQPGTGAYDGVAVPADVYGLASGAPRTVEGWFQTTLAGDHSIIGIAGNASANTPWLSVGLHGGQPWACMRDSVGQKTALGPSTVNDGNVHHIAATMDDITLRLYVDGEQVASTAAGAPTGARTRAMVGALYRGSPYVTPPTCPFPIDAGAFYPTALSAARIEAHYLAGSGQAPTLLSGAATAEVTASGLVIVTRSLTGAATAEVTAAGTLRRSVTLAGAATVEVAAAGALTVPGLVALTGAATVEVTAAGTLTVVPVTPPGGTTDWESDPDDPINGRDRSGSGDVDEVPPVAPAPPGIAQPRVLTGGVLPTAVTVTDGRPQAMAALRLPVIEWGRLRLRIGARDLTYFRGVLPEVTELQLTDPYGWGPATIRFPQVHRLEQPNFGSGDLDWLTLGVRARLERVDPGGDTSLLWVGEFTAPEFDTDGCLVAQFSGAVSGLLARTQREKRLVRRVRDTGDLLRACFFWNEVGETFGFDLTPIEGWLGATGIEQENTTGASGNNLTAVTEILAAAIADDGTPWTLVPTDDDYPTIDLRERDRETVQATIVLGAHGVDDNLTTDLMESPNWITGDGVAPDGSRWNNARYPELAEEEQLPFPNDGGTAIQPGDTDADTDSGDGVTVMQSEMLGSGWISLADYSNEAGTYGPRTQAGIRDLQRESGLAVTGIVNVATWNAVFSTDRQSLTGAFVMPLWSAPEVTKWFYTSNGSIRAANPAYRPSVARVPRHISYGPGWTVSAARRHAKALAAQLAGADRHGSITLDADVVAGEWTPADGDPTPMSRLDLRPWKGDVSVYNPATGTAERFHIAQMSLSDASTVKPKVTLAVDKAGRSYVDLAALRERDERAKRDPAREWLATHTQSKSTADRMIGWDAEAGAGKLPGNALTAGWNVLQVVGGQGGTIDSIRVKLDRPAEFAVSVTALRVGPMQMAGLIGNPLTAEAEQRWEDATEYLLSRGWLGSFGTLELPCGYWPRRKTRSDGTATGAALTGKFRDSASWTYKSSDPFLWVQIWVDRDCRIARGPDSQLYVVLDENT